MKILAFSPSDLGPISGNVVTIRRIQGALRERGHTFDIVPVSPSTSPDEARDAAARSGAEVLHFYHAYKTGRLLPHVPGFPAVVTVSGTDINQDYQDPKLRPVIDQALARAARVVTYNRSIVERLPSAILLPKGVLVGSTPFDLRKAAGYAPGEFVFFHPGGIRPVKNNIFAIDALAPLVRDFPHLRLLFAGPVRDEPYGEEFQRRIRRARWASHLEHIPPDGMTAAYREVDVALNTSLSEGVSNALIEAMVAGRAVLASDIPGNRDLLGAHGLLYKDRPEFTQKARRLIGDGVFRRDLGQQAASYAAATFSTDREVEALLRVYGEIVQTDRRPVR